MDIRKFAVEETAVLHLKDANDELMYADGADGNPDTNKPMRIKLYGPGSKKYAKIQAANNNKLFTRLKKKGKEDQSADDKAQESADTLTALTHSFENIGYDELGGEALYKAVYLDTSIGFIATQVNAYLNDWANFTKASATN
ncbi:hypothetical protein CLU92_5470 [Janthinobacterium sp. 61]|uniref:hypothetical protein n=1 Tax=Janthinobacterium sp. 61 TaxID=2035209 RepID=UPI000C700CD6|nr:hypothetical protein [Janthinobacterium sp. 61]PKV47995.1 hypothetical protein CLU92_5470 [Janthinobacterium sp. 61]